MDPSLLAQCVLAPQTVLSMHSAQIVSVEPKSTLNLRRLATSVLVPVRDTVQRHVLVPLGDASNSHYNSDVAVSNIKLSLLIG